MTNKLFSCLVIGAAVFNGLNSTPALAFSTSFRPSVQNKSRRSSRRPALAKPSKTVEVMFDGLMVIRRAGDHYELGVVDADVAAGHTFMIFKNGKRMPPADVARLVGIGKSWTLDIVTASGAIKTPDIAPRAVRPCNRPADTKPNEPSNHAQDFCWVIDMENDFNGGQPLTLKPDKLTPIIQLKNGELLTKFKFEQVRRGSPAGCVDYGFISETIAVKITLAAGEKLQLRVNGASGPPTIALELSKNRERATMLNASQQQMEEKTSDMRDCDAPPSHFVYYYDLFSDYTGPRYDIYNKPNALLPINRLTTGRSAAEDFKMSILTEDHQACGIVFLGVSNGPLP